MNAQVSDIAAEEGLDYHLETAKYSNTFDAHRLIHLATQHGLQHEMTERLMRAYFTESATVGDTRTLVELAAEVGLDAGEVHAALESDAYAGDVRADEQRGRMFGVRGVPFFAIDEKYGVSGAQPVEVFTSALEQAWADSHPLVQLVTAGGQDADLCEDDSCAV
jgi:predicted DsbA family dithiol-disulfide isomerase